MKKLYFISILLFIFSCEENQNNSHIPTELEEENFEQENSNQDTLVEDLKDLDIFTLIIDSLYEKFNELGFYYKDSLNIVQDEAIDKHEWILSFKNNENKHESEYYPNQNDINKIKGIRKIVFKKAYEVSIEEWSFGKNIDLHYWSNVSAFNTRNEHTKPPKFHFTDNNKLYFVTFNTASYFFDYKVPFAKIITHKNRELLYLLETPLNLRAFKKKKGQSNSGGADTKEYWHKPDTTGMYYSYFLFPTPSNISESTRFSDCEITTFKYNSEIGKFKDTNEELIEIKLKYNDYDFGAFNWVDRDMNDMIDFYGEADSVFKDVYIYHYNKKVFLCSVSKGKIKKIKYVRLIKNFEQISDEYFEDLTQW